MWPALPVSIWPQFTLTRCSADSSCAQRLELLLFWKFKLKMCVCSVRLHHVTCRHLLRLTLTINAALTEAGAVTPLLPDITEPPKTSWSSTFLNTALSFICCLHRLQKNSDTLLTLRGIHLTLCVSDAHRVRCVFDRVQWRKRRSRPEFGGEQSPDRPLHEARERTEMLPTILDSQLQMPRLLFTHESVSEIWPHFLFYCCFDQLWEICF